MSGMKIEYKGGIVAEIEHDGDCGQPYADDEAVKIVVLHRRYVDPSGGVCGKTPEEVERWAKANKKDWYVVPLWMYDHSGTAYRVGAENPFTCPWDSGRVGVVALKKSDWGKGMRETDSKRFEYAQAVAEEYTKWANGECYGYVIKDEDGVALDSCFGFIGYDAVKEAADEAAEFYASRNDHEEAKASAPAFGV